MLRHLNIKGLAIIESLTIDFSSGFNVITGETGAGKSILIKALTFLTGAKGNVEAVRRGFDVAVVTGTFRLRHGHRALEVLAAMGIPAGAGDESDADDESQDVIVRRTMTAKGKSSAWINDVPVTMHALREFAEALIDIFAQHESHRMLDPANHLAYVDQFIKDKKIESSFRAAYSEIAGAVSQLNDVVAEFGARAKDADYLIFRCDELSKFDPSAEDFDAIKKLCERASRFVNMAAAMQRAQALIDEGAGGDSLARPVKELMKVFSSLSSAVPEMEQLANDAADIATKIEDLSFRMGKFTGGIDADEESLESAQTRLAGYQSLFRKLAVADVDGLVAEWERLAGELRQFEAAAKNVVALVAEIYKSLPNLENCAAQLTKARTKAVSAVSKAIQSELAELAMPGAVLEVRFTPVQRSNTNIDLQVVLAGGNERDAAFEQWEICQRALASVGPDGAEDAQFYLASNPGEPTLPLARIASGGEVSRIMLAFKKVLVAGADTCILVFDEIDTGISGRVASIVGQKLREISQHVQIICISHLAQVAAFSDAHFRVHKFGKDKRTESTISRLTERESTEEIARLLSGAEVSTASLSNAKALIAKARENDRRSPRA